MYHVGGVPFHRVNITDSEKAAVIDVLESGWLTYGNVTIRFEEEFAEKNSVEYALAVNSCTSALHLAMVALGIGECDEVIVPTNTFVASAEAVTYVGATPVFCDILEETHAIDPDKIESLVTDRTAAIMPVHFAGIPCEMDEIVEIARRHDLKIVCDSAHAYPARYKGESVANIGDVACFSFYATKTLSTGEGGMATTNDPALYEAMKRHRLHGVTKDANERMSAKNKWEYDVTERGFKYNTTDMASALGREQLKIAEINRLKRKSIADRYDEAFTGKIDTLMVPGDRESAYHLYIVKTDERMDLISHLDNRGIGTSVHFIPIHRMTWYRDRYGLIASDYPVAESVFERSVSLPIFPDMTDEEVQAVIDGVLSFVE